MNICVLNESIWTENAQANLEELIGRTKGKKNILLIGENIYCMADRAETAAVLQKKVRKSITDSARKSRRKLQTIRYPDGACRIEFRDLQIGWYIPKRDAKQGEMTWQDAEEYEERIRRELKMENASAMYLTGR